MWSSQCPSYCLEDWAKIWSFWRRTSKHSQMYLQQKDLENFLLVQNFQSTEVWLDCDQVWSSSIVRCCLSLTCFNGCILPSNQRVLTFGCFPWCERTAAAYRSVVYLWWGHRVSTAPSSRRGQTQWCLCVLSLETTRPPAGYRDKRKPPCSRGWKKTATLNKVGSHQ